MTAGVLAGAGMGGLPGAGLAGCCVLAAGAGATLTVSGVAATGATVVLGTLSTAAGALSTGVACAAALPPSGPTRASALALSSAEIASLPAWAPLDALLALLALLPAPVRPFMLLAIITPPAMAATSSASAAHLIQALLPRTGSWGKAGVRSLRGANAAGSDCGGLGAGVSMGSIKGGVRLALSTACEAPKGMGGAVAAAAWSAPGRSNTMPHRVQKRASGLQTDWHWLQIFSAAVIAASGSCLAPQLLQNLAVGESGLPHWEQFMVCNREKSPQQWPLGGIAALAMREIGAGFCALA